LIYIFIEDAIITWTIFIDDAIIMHHTKLLHTALHYRADESGIPFCITVDFDSLTDDSVTVRERDSMVQTRMKVIDVLPYLSKQIDGF
jgi:hypothetical protein